METYWRLILRPWPLQVARGTAATGAAARLTGDRAVPIAGNDVESHCA